MGWGRCQGWMTGQFWANGEGIEGWIDFVDPPPQKKN